MRRAEGTIQNHADPISFSNEDILPCLGRGALTVDTGCRIVSSNMHAHKLLALDSIRDCGQPMPDSLKEIHIRLQACTLQPF